MATKLNQARTARKKGDALRNANQEERARAAYRAGVAALTDALRIAAPHEALLAAKDLPLEAGHARMLDDLVEIYGALGGIHQRLESPVEASESYSRGAALEERFRHRGTYNRLNAVKSALLAGTQTLRASEPQLRALAAVIETQMQESVNVSDSGWAWADLGDCLALLGDAEGARRAYAKFISKAETKSPERTLQVLETIAAKLRELGDPDVGRLAGAIDALKSRLAV
ncbi:MAG TPA: hypothetical protein VF432_29000 [Thermoanaerobaculia bacterium]